MLKKAAQRIGADIACNEGELGTPAGAAVVAADGFTRTSLPSELKS